jgi:hypothetical protein
MNVDIYQKIHEIVADSRRNIGTTRNYTLGVRDNQHTYDIAITSKCGKFWSKLTNIPILKSLVAWRFVTSKMTIGDREFEFSGSASSVEKKVKKCILDAAGNHIIMDLRDIIDIWLSSLRLPSDLGESEFLREIDSGDLPLPKNKSTSLISLRRALRYMARDTKDVILSKKDIEELAQFLQNPLRSIKINYRGSKISIEQLAKKIESGDRSSAPRAAKEILDNLDAIRKNLAGQCAFNELSEKTKHFLKSK